jgi:hypothetical protein
MTALNQIDAASALAFGKSALESENHIEAHAYFTHVLETEPENVQALMGKGLAAGWQSNLRSSRLVEMLRLYEQVKDLSPAGSTIPNEMATDMVEVLMAYDRLSREHTMKFISVPEARYEAFDRAEESLQVLDVLRGDHATLAKEVIVPMMTNILRSHMNTSGLMGDQLTRFKIMLKRIELDSPEEQRKAADAKSNDSMSSGAIVAIALGYAVLYFIIQPASVGGWLFLIFGGSMILGIAGMAGIFGYATLMAKLHDRKEKRQKLAEGKSPGQV